MKKNIFQRGKVPAQHKFLFSFIGILLLQVVLQAPQGQAQEDLMRDSLDATDIQNQGQEKTRSETELLEYADWLREDSPEKASVIYQEFLSKYPSSPQISIARLGQSRCLLALGHLLEAFDAVEASFPVKLPTAEILTERCAVELDIARQLAKIGNQPIAAGASGKEKNETGTEAASRVFVAILYNDPQGRYVPDALVGLGDAQFALGNILEAKRSYLEVVKDYPNHPLANTARIRGAKSLILERERGQVLLERLLDAEGLIQRVGPLEELVPPLKVEASEVLRLLDNGQAEEKLQQAEFYLKSSSGNKRNAGIYLLERIIQLHPDTEIASDARQRLQELGK